MTTDQRLRPTVLVAPLRSVVGAIFHTLARVRRAPAVHPRAQSFDATLVLDEQAHPFPTGTHRALAKLSKGAGTPGSRADVLGIAVRADLGTGLWDILFSTAGQGRLTRWLPRPARSWDSTSYSTLSPYAVGDRRLWMRLTATGSDLGHASVEALTREAPKEFTVSVAGRRDGWKPVGVLRLRSPRPDHPVIDPVLNHPAGLDLAPAWLRELRELAYSSSRHGRKAEL